MKGAMKVTFVLTRISLLWLWHLFQAYNQQTMNVGAPWCLLRITAPPPPPTVPRGGRELGGGQNNAAATPSLASPKQLPKDPEGTAFARNHNWEQQFPFSTERGLGWKIFPLFPKRRLPVPSQIQKEKSTCCLIVIKITK